MRFGASRLVLKKIDNLDIDENRKQAIKEMITIEFEHGDTKNLNRNARTRKIKRVMEMVARRCDNENIQYHN